MSPAPLRAPNGRSFVEWNDEMVERFDPGAYHERSHVAIRAIERLRTWQIVRLLDVGPRDRVLEVGVGAGNVLERVPSARRVGLDLSLPLLARARVRLGAQARILRGDAAALPFGCASFDRVLSSEVLEHLPDPAAAVAEMVRVVRPGGVIVLSVPNERFIDRVKGLLGRLGLLSRLSSDGYRIPTAMKDEWHLREFDLRLFRQVIEPSLELEQIVWVPHRALPLRLIARCRPR